MIREHSGTARLFVFRHREARERSRMFDDDTLHMVVYSTHQHAPHKRKIRARRLVCTQQPPKRHLRRHSLGYEPQPSINQSTISITCSYHSICTTPRQHSSHSQDASSTHKSINSLHSTVNINPCNPFANIFVFNPLPSSPLTPSVAITALAASVYPILVSFTCRYVLTTRSELDTVSEIADATKPMNAYRQSFKKKSSGTGRFLLRMFCVPHHLSSRSVSQSIATCTTGRNAHTG